MASNFSNQLRNLKNASILRILAHRFPNSSTSTYPLSSVRYFSNGASHSVPPVEPSASFPTEIPQSNTNPKVEKAYATASASSSLKDVELAKFAAIAETWYFCLLIYFFSPLLCDGLWDCFQRTMFMGKESIIMFGILLLGFGGFVLILIMTLGV